MKKHERKYRITNRCGIHARPAALIVKAMSALDCDVEVEKDGNKVSGKSIMGLLSLAASFGSTVVVRASGDDAAEALNEFGRLIELKFEEQ